MTNGSYTFLGNVSFVQVQPNTPACCKCGGFHPDRRTPDRKYWHTACLDEHNRAEAIRTAADWFAAVFASVKREHRGKLYRALSAIYHPDMPTGDEPLMKALNASKEKFT